MDATQELVPKGERGKIRCWVDPVELKHPSFLPNQNNMNNTDNKNQWQPIETAPKDGTHILVFENDSGFNVEVMIANYYGGNGCWSISWDDRGIEINPTHWMPLPKLPETK